MAATIATTAGSTVAAVMAPRWSSTTKTLHWGIALLIVLLAPAGFVMSRTYGASFKDGTILDLHILASRAHHTMGFILLAGALAWIAHRLRRRRPPFDPAVPRSQRRLVVAVHGALLGLLVVIPWSGWTALSALEDSAQFGNTHIWFFAWDRVLPRIWTPLPFSDPGGYALFARLHRWALWAGLTLVGLHVASAFWHHAVRRDGVLRRMWPLTDTPTG